MTSPDECDPLLTFLTSLVNYDYAARIRQLVRSTELASVAELGCGTGRNLCVAALACERPVTFVGCDVSLSSIKRAAESVGQCLTARTGLAHRTVLIPVDGAEAPLADSSFDLVLLIHVLHHASDFALLHEARRILRPGGRLLLVDIAADNPINSLLRRLWKRLPLRLKSRFSDDFCFEGSAAPVRLIPRTELNSETKRLGLKLLCNEDDNLFFFSFFYAAKLLPRPVRRVLPRALWLPLYRLEQLALRASWLRAHGAGIGRVYELPAATTQTGKSVEATAGG